jgi:hypothetical protein
VTEREAHDGDGYGEELAQWFPALTDLEHQEPVWSGVPPSL